MGKGIMPKQCQHNRGGFRFFQMLLLLASKSSEWKISEELGATAMLLSIALRRKKKYLFHPSGHNEHNYYEHINRQFF